jgi:hypothetical protein
LAWTPAEFDTETMAVMLAKARLKKPFATFVIADLPIN